MVTAGNGTSQMGVDTVSKETNMGRLSSNFLKVYEYNNTIAYNNHKNHIIIDRTISALLWGHTRSFRVECYENYVRNLLFFVISESVCHLPPFQPSLTCVVYRGKHSGEGS
jgi:hypothetical protein